MAYLGPFCMVISAGVKQNGSDVFNILDPDSGGGNTFSVPLSANAALPATHFGCRSMLEAATHNALTTMGTTQFKAYVDALQVQRGRQAVGSITAFKNNIQISAANGNFNTFIASLGLQRVADPL